MRSARAAKFAEYLSTYAILHNIALHNTVLIEKRDSSKGVGVYVRDACDAQTTLIVVPAKRCFATSVARRVGLGVDWTIREYNTPYYNSVSSCNSIMESESISLAPFALDANGTDEMERQQCEKSETAICESLDDGIISYLSQCNGQSRKWIEWCWRLSLERQRAHSPWWGWLQSLPTIDENKENNTAVLQLCSIHHPELRPFYEKAMKQIESETLIAYKYICNTNIHTPLHIFQWAVDVLLTRGIIVPACWNDRLNRSNVCTNKVHNHDNGNCDNTKKSSEWKEEEVPWSGDEKNINENNEEEDEVHDMFTELAVIPFVDLVNGIVPFDDDANKSDNEKDVCANMTREKETNSNRGAHCMRDVYSSSSGTTLSNTITEQSLRSNAVIDVATSYTDLPSWYVQSVKEEAARSGNDCVRNVQRLFDDSYFLCLTLTEPITASSEVLLPYSMPVITTSVLTPAQNARLTQYVKYKF